jgi:hypothetical protein
MNTRQIIEFDDSRPANQEKYFPLLEKAERATPRLSDQPAA